MVSTGMAQDAAHGLQKASHFLEAENDRQPVRLGHHGEMARHLWLVERDAAEEPQRRNCGVTVAAGTPV